jgi:hypothetical protein
MIKNNNGIFSNHDFNKAIEAERDMIYVLFKNEFLSLI